MKKTLLIVAGISIAAIILFLAVITLIAIRAAKNNQFTLIKETGNVIYKNISEREYTPLTEDEVNLNSGYDIKTAENSSAQIILPDNSIITLEENSEIQLNYSKNNYSINQLIGNSWHRVESVTDGGSYEVTTPNTIAAVRGTNFAVIVEDEGEFKSSICVEESTVDVTNTLTDKTESITKGEYIPVQQGLRFRKQDTPDELREKDWYKRNLELDEKIKELKASGNFSKKVLRKKLREKLFEVRQERVENIRERLQEVKGESANNDFENAINPLIQQYTQLQPGDNSALCTYYSSANVEQIIAIFESVEEQYQVEKQAAQDFIDQLTKISNACKDDGKIDEEELQELNGN